MGTKLAVEECRQWKLVGAIIWHSALFMLGATIWHGLAFPGHRHSSTGLSIARILYTLMLYAFTLLVLYTQRRVMATIDVPPVHVARLGWSGKSWPSLFIARCIIRTRQLWDVVDVLSFYAACVTSSCLGLYLLQPTSSSTRLQPLLTYGTVLGLMYAVTYLIRGKSMLSFPTLHRHRYFRIKQRLRAVARTCLILSTTALLASLATNWLLLPPQTPLLSAWGGWTGVLGLWRAALLAVWAWAAGGHVLEVVFTERVAMASDDDLQPTAPLLEALQSKDPMVQDWCLMDLAAVAEGAAGCRKRQAAVFSDETGSSGWIPIARYCLTELKDFVAVMSAALPALQGRTAGSGGGKGGMKWNVLQLSAAGGRTVNRSQDMALWHLQARYHRLAWSLRILSGLSAAGLRLDKYGVLQLSTPGLSDVLTTLLAVVTVLQAFIKDTSSIPSQPGTATARLLDKLIGSGSSSGGAAQSQQQHHVAAAACALLDVAKTCTYRVTNTYGAVLASVVAQSKSPIGTSAQAQALLKGFLTYEE